jgi:hypothetical protein
MTAPVTTPATPAPPLPSWVPSRKVIAGVTTNILTWAVALLVSHYSLHEDSLTAGIVTAVIGIVAGAVAGYMIREIPRLEQDVKPVAKGM